MSESDNENTEIYEEIGQLIDQCHQLHDSIDNSFNALNRIKNLLSATIYISYNGSKMDFNELLELCHTESLENIKKTGKTNFGEKLLEALDIAVFDNL